MTDRAGELSTALNMSREEFIEQAVCFAYANARMSNPDITKDTIRIEADAMFDSRCQTNKG